MWHLRIFCLSARILLAPLQRCLSLVTLGPVNRESQNQNFNECGISKPSLKSTHVIDLWHWVTDWFIAWEIKSRKGLSFHVLNHLSSHVMHCLWWHAWCYRPSALPSQGLRKQLAVLISTHFYSSARCAAHSRLVLSCLLFWKQPGELQIADCQDSSFPHKRPTANGRGSCCTPGAVSRPRGLDWRVETFNLELSFLKMINHTRIQRKVSDWIHTTWLACRTALVTQIFFRSILVIIQNGVLERVSWAASQTN